MHFDYKSVSKRADELLSWLVLAGVDAHKGSPLERDYLATVTEIDEYYSDGKLTLSDDARSAATGILELHRWLSLIRSRPEFELLVPHLKMLSTSAIRINQATPYNSPHNNKPDDKSNKLLETVLAMFAMYVGTDIELDDPIKSSQGTNPDILFTYKNKRVGIACKTIHSTKEMTLLQNIEKAAEQIDRSDCEIGVVAINAMNVLPHEQINSVVFDSLNPPLTLLLDFVNAMYDSVGQNCRLEINEIYSHTKACGTLLTLVHSSTRLHSSHGSLATSIKATCASTLHTDIHKAWCESFYDKFNSFIHGQLRPDDI